MPKHPAASDRRPRYDRRARLGRPGPAARQAATGGWRLRGRSRPGRLGASAIPAAGASLSAPARRSLARGAVRGCLLIGLLAGVRPAAAQIPPVPTDVPVGERHRVELAGSLWGPAQELTVGGFGASASGAAGGAGGILPRASAPRFLDARLRLRLSRRQRVHFDYLPIRYAADGGPTGGAPAGAASTLTWKTWRLAWQYDVIRRARGSIGLFAEAAYNDVQVARDNAAGRPCAAGTGCELARVRRPVPGVGGTVRLYPSPVVMLGAEASLFRTLPGVGDLLDYTGEHTAWDVHAALNFIDAFGLQVGYRSRHLHLQTAGHDADLRLEGMYVGALLRF